MKSDNLYTIHVIQNDGNYFHCVYETLSQQLYDFFFFREDAERCAEFLSSGGGFNGFTPSFMLQEIKLNKDQKFSLEFND